jgi:hypothetical protein
MEIPTSLGFLCCSRDASALKVKSTKKIYLVLDVQWGSIVINLWTNQDHVRNAMITQSVNFAMARTLQPLDLVTGVQNLQVKNTFHALIKLLVSAEIKLTP